MYIPCAEAAWICTYDTAEILSHVLKSNKHVLQRFLRNMESHNTDSMDVINTELTRS